MILVPKFLEFIALSIPAFICNNCCCIVFIWSIMCFALGNFGPEPLFEDFLEKSLKSPRFFLAGNKANVLDQLCTYDIHVYSVVYRNCMIGISLRAPMLETTRTLTGYSLVTP
jgi:hypothetical protein